MSLVRAVRQRSSSVPTHVSGYNLPRISYFYATYPFLDVGKSGSGFYSPSGAGPANSDAWFPAMPNGTQVLRGLCLSLDPVYGYFPPGAYEVVSTSGMTLSVDSGTGVTPTGNGVGRATFTITALPGAWGGLNPIIRATNNTGSTAAFLDCRINLVSDAARIIAGEIFDPEYVAAYANARILRIHDWTNIDDRSVAQARYFSEFPQNESKVNYIGNNYPPGAGGMPVSIGIKFAKAVGARPWLNVPVGAGYYFLRATAGRVTMQYEDQVLGSGHFLDLATNPLTEGEGFRFFGGGGVPYGLHPFVLDTTYYAKNVDSTSFQISLTPGGAAVPFTNDAAPITTTGTTTSGSLVITGIPSTAGIVANAIVLCANFEQGYTFVASVDSSTQITVVSSRGNGPSQAQASGSASITFYAAIRPIFCNFCTVATITPDFYNNMMLPWLTAAYNADPTSKPLLEPSNEVWNSGFPTYPWMRSIGGLLAGADFNPGAGYAWFLLHLRKAARTLWGDGNFTIVHGNQMVNFANLGSAFDFVDPGIVTAGQDLKTQEIAALAAGGSVPAVVYSVAIYLGQSGTSDTTPGRGFGYNAMEVAYSDNGTTVIPDSYWNGKFAEEIVDRIPEYTSAVSQARAKVPNMPLVLYEWGQQLNDGPGTLTANGKLVADNYLAYLDGHPGKVMYQSFWETVVAPFNVYAACHFVGAGGRINNTGQGLYAWPIIGPDNTETERSLYVKTL